MAPFESTTRQVGAGVSGTLKSDDTRRMLFPFSTECETVPVLALGPWNMDDVWVSMPAAQTALTASNAVSAKTDSKRLSCFISVLLLVCWLLLDDLHGMSVWIANDYRFPEPRLRVRQFNNPRRDEGGPGP